MKNLFRVVLGLMAAASLSAYDFGLNLADATAYSQGADATLNQNNHAELWFETPVAEAQFRAEASYDFSSSWTTPDKSTIVPYRFDLGQFDLSGVAGLPGGGAIDWDVGRFNMADLSSSLVTGKADGLSATYYRGNVRVGTQAFYTGLVMKKSTRVSVSVLDKVDAANDKVLLAPSRVVGSLNLGIQEFLFRQDFELEVLGNYDLRPEVANSLHTIWATARLSGPLVSLTRYKLGATGEWLAGGQADGAGTSLAGLGFLQVTTNIPWQSAKLVLEGQGSYNFVPISMKPLSLAVPTLSLGNLGAAWADFSLKPLPKMTLGVKQGAFVRPTGDYLGSETQSYLAWKASSELNLALNGGLFLPSGELLTPEVPWMYSVALTANLAL